jgi:hypothetical protein
MDCSLTIQAMYVQCNTAARLGNHCCRRKALSITYSECLSVALVIRHKKRMRVIKLASLVFPTEPRFLHVIS